jgi:hypothetical protein
MKNLSTLLVLMCSAVVAFAQMGTPTYNTSQGRTGTSNFFELNPYVGYTTSSKLDFGVGKYRAFGSANFGGNLGFGRKANMGNKHVFTMGQIQYNYQPTDVELFVYVPQSNTQLGGLDVHTISIGMLRGGGTDQFSVYGGGYLGVLIYNPANNEYESTTKFTPSFAGGFNYAFNDNFGFRAQAQLYMPVWGADFGLGWCIGCGGLSPTVYSDQVSVFANFSGGVYYRFVN